MWTSFSFFEGKVLSLKTYFWINLRYFSSFGQYLFCCPGKQEKMTRVYTDDLGSNARLMRMINRISRTRMSTIQYYNDVLFSARAKCRTAQQVMLDTFFFWLKSISAKCSVFVPSQMRSNWTISIQFSAVT